MRLGGWWLGSLSLKLSSDEVEDTLAVDYGWWNFGTALGRQLTR